MGRKEHVSVRGRNEGLALLTERELEVLKLVAGGKNNKEIAVALFIGEPTVKTHVANLMNKLGLRDRVEAVLFAIQTGVVNIN
jgi:DNA-binding NarL/FixJ family response regulator